MLNELSGMGLSVIRKITDLWAGAKADSLIDYTQVARVEPIVLIDANCLFLTELLPEVQQSLLSIFAGYYLQAVAISTTVGKIEVVRHLDKINPHRNPVDSGANTMGWLLAQESYRFKLPTPNDSLALEGLQEDKFNLDSAKFDFDKSSVVAKREMDEKTVAARAEEVKKTYDLNKEKFGHDKAMSIAKADLDKAGLALKERELTASEIGFGRDTMSQLRELANLSVGKMLEVNITDGLHKAAIPITIRLMASSLPSNSLIHILSRGSEDTSMKERYHAWKSDRIEFIRDLCFCQDLINRHRSNLMADSEGIYTSLLKRNRGNQLATIVSGNPSVATASNMVILSSATANELEVKLNGHLRDFKTREAVFKQTYIMIMVVIDVEWERVTFYHRGINAATEVSLKDMKSSNKGSGPDVSDILKAYQLGNSPSL